MIVIILSFLLPAEHTWHLFTGASHVRLAGVAVWELVWGTQ